MPKTLPPAPTLSSRPEQPNFFFPITLPVRWLGCEVEGPLFSASSTALSIVERGPLFGRWATLDVPRGRAAPSAIFKGCALRVSAPAIFATPGDAPAVVARALVLSIVEPCLTHSLAASQHCHPEAAPFAAEKSHLIGIQSKTIVENRAPNFPFSFLSSTFCFPVFSIPHGEIGWLLHVSFAFGRL